MGYKILQATTCKRGGLIHKQRVKAQMSLCICTGLIIAFTVCTDHN